MNRKLVCAAISAAFTLSVLPVPASAEAEPKLIALTFDDGPNTTTTNEVLDLLEEYHAKASFFLIGDNINDESAKSVKRAYDMGCEIDNHSKTHSNMGAMPAETIEAELSYVDEWVEKITGEKTKFFRPPFIDVSQSMYDAISLPFICGIDCQDYMENVNAETRANYILDGAKDGIIVLLHDAAGNSQTVDALKIAMPELVKRGYEFVTLTELFARQGETPRRNMLYTRVAKYPCGDYTVKENLFTGTVSGDQASGEWQNAGTLDKETLAALGADYAIEMHYSGSSQPVLNLQKWSGTAIWHSVQPEYANGEVAVFMGADILAALESLGVDYADLDRMSVAPLSGTMEMTQLDLLVPGDTPAALAGDVNADGTVNMQDAVALMRYLTAKDNTLRAWKNGDLDGSGHLSAHDLTLLKQQLLSA